MACVQVSREILRALNEAVNQPATVSNQLRPTHRNNTFQQHYIYHARSGDGIEDV